MSFAVKVIIGIMAGLLAGCICLIGAVKFVKALDMTPHTRWQRQTVIQAGDEWRNEKEWNEMYSDISDRKS